MTRRPAAEIGSDLKAWLAKRDMTGQQLADAVSAANAGQKTVSQSWISRIGSGDFKRITGQVSLVLDYANIPIDQSSRPDPSSKAIIEEALGEVWDGSPDGARAIAQVLRGVGRFASQQQSTAGRRSGNSL